AIEYVHHRMEHRPTVQLHSKVAISPGFCLPIERRLNSNRLASTSRLKQTRLHNRFPTLRVRTLRTMQECPQRNQRLFHVSSAYTSATRRETTCQLRCVATHRRALCPNSDRRP